MDNSPLFSIIIPTYNYGHTLSRCIDSILKQSVKSVEILVIDDGSTDDTLETVKSYLLLKNFRYVHQLNQGPARARNQGAALATGNYLIFLDADDELTTESLSIIKTFIENNAGVEVFIGKHITFHDDGKQKLSTDIELPPTHLQRFKRYLFKTINICNGATVIKREIFSKIQYPENLHIGEDIPVNAQLLALFDCKAINQPLAIIHKHQDSLRHQASLSLGKESELIAAIFNPKILPKEFFIYKDRYFAKHHLSIFRNLFLQGDFEKAKNYYWQAIKIYPLSLFKISYLRKMLKIFFKQHAT